MNHPTPNRPIHHRPRNGLGPVAAGLLALIFTLAGAPARGAGIPVIDVASLTQAITQVSQSITQINNQYEQIRHAYEQVNSLSRARGLGDVLNNPLLQNYIPSNAAQLLLQLEQGGYSGLDGATRALRDAEMVYNCLDLAGAERTRCQAALARPYQGKAFMQRALDTARQRTGQINALMRRAGATTDVKEATELQARIAAENALLQHEVSQIQLIRGLAEAEERIAQSQAREAQLQQTSRNRRLGEFFTP